MLTSRSTAEELIIEWRFDAGVKDVPGAFAEALAELSAGSCRICEYRILGPCVPDLSAWRCFISSLEPLLDHGVRLRFVCSCEATYARMSDLGLALLGDVSIDASLIDAAPYDAALKD